jgi:hypothetical protein
MLAAERLPSVSSDMIRPTLRLIISQVYSVQIDEYDEYEAGLGKRSPQMDDPRALRLFIQPCVTRG